jgi:hypothetical protein
MTYGNDSRGTFLIVVAEELTVRTGAKTIGKIRVIAVRGESQSLER